MDTLKRRAQRVADQQRWRERHPEKNLEIRHKGRDAWRARHPERRAAHQAVYRAVKAGHLVRPGTCQRCGTDCRPEASHDDYSKPLDVEWLCRRCHLNKDWPLVSRATTTSATPSKGD